MIARIKTLHSRGADARARDEGQTMAEYGLILALVAVLAMAAFTALQGGITGTINTIVASL